MNSIARYSWPLCALALLTSPLTFATTDDDSVADAMDTSIAGTKRPQIDVAHCYDFSRLAVGNRYEVGDEVRAENGVVKLGRYRINGTVPQTDVQFAEVRQSRIAGGSPPELRMVRTNPVVVLDEPVSIVKMRFAENSGGTGPHNNLTINRFRREVDGSLATIDGLVVGNSASQKYRVRVVMDERRPANAGDWHSGELRITALNGRNIRRFGLSGTHLMGDNFCAYDNAVLAPPVALETGR